MKNISNNLKKSLSDDTLNLVRCWKITLKNNKILCFTTSDEDFIYENQKYISIGSNDINDLKTNIDIEEDEAEISNLIISDIIEANDILSGCYDGADVELFIFDKKTQEKITLLNGFISDIEYKDNIFNAKVKGLKSKLNKVIGEVYTPLCRCQFCDEKCKLNKENFTFNGEISNLINSVEFETNTLTIINKIEGYFENGVIEFTSGKNIGFKTEVKQSKNNSIILSAELPYELQNGDKFKITAGCNKEFDTCCNVFYNAINFRGEPHLPGINILLKVM